MTKEEMQEIKISFGRCLTHGDLFQEFYNGFLKSDPCIAPMFANTDFDKQKGLLKQGLNLALMYADGNVIGQSGLRKIRKTHARNDMNIAPHLYPLWINSFLATVEKMDPQMTPQLLAKWRGALTVAVDYIKGGYLET
ncbi:MAG: hypothetical protein NE330_04345 [Lentisphaeraceae bacterium]|nr:hypothetical protein [Lentisphaeraceae bacterium]